MCPKYPYTLPLYIIKIYKPYSMYSISLLSKPFSLVLINFSSFPLLHIKGIKILPKHPSIILTLIVKKKNTNN